MADPVKRPLVWNKKFLVYAEKHGIYDVLQELMKELAIWKPEDPLLYIRDELGRIGRSIFTPKVFMLGPDPLTSHLAEGIANHCGAKYLSLEDIIMDTTEGLREHLAFFLEGEDTEDEALRKLLVATIARRISMQDCINSGFVLYGFPQSRAQAMMAQSCGLIPRQVFIILPQGPPGAIKEVASTMTPNVPTANDDLFAIGRTQTQLSLTDLDTYRGFFVMKEIASAYINDNIKIAPYHHWNSISPSDLEVEFLGYIITRKPAGAPWIPRILLIGPPASGKSKLASYLAGKFKIIDVGWVDLIRAAAIFDDDVGDACKQYLEDLVPIADDVVSTLLQRRLSKDDCMKKGYVMHGFPETLAQALVLDDLGFNANRVFLLSCTDTVCRERMSKKLKGIMKNRLPDHPIFYQQHHIPIPYDAGDTDKPKLSFGHNPYDPVVTNVRIEMFNTNIEALITHYGSDLIFVDAIEPYELVQEFVDTATLRPPNVRFD